jgi:uncharacterized protein (DUF1499 family)
MIARGNGIFRILPKTAETRKQFVYWVLLAIGVGGALALGAALVGLYMIRAATPDRDELRLGLEDGRLAPCPHVPNCVSTQVSPEDDAHRVEPISYRSSRSRLMEQLAHFVEDELRGTLVTQDQGYLHAEIRSRFFGFVDDLELFAPEGEGELHLRSASRVGYGDMGVNRKRYLRVRRFVEELEAGPRA